MRPVHWYCKLTSLLVKIYLLHSSFLLNKSSLIEASICRAISLGNFHTVRTCSGSLAGLVKVQVNITVKFLIHTVRESELDVTISAQE